MKAPVGKNKLLARLVLALLPASALPLFVFGYVSIKSHYESLRTQSLQGHRTLVTFMGRQLDHDVTLAIHQMQIASKTEVFKTRNLFMVREALSNFREMAQGADVTAFVDTELKALVFDPPNPDEGKKMSEAFFQDLDDNGLFVSRLTTDEGSVPGFRVVQQIKGVDGAPAGFLYTEFSLKSWIQTSRQILKNHPTLLAAILPTGKGADPIRLNAEADLKFWAKVAAIRSGKSAAAEQDIDGDPHHVMFQEVDAVRAKLVVAEPLASIYASPKQVLVTYVGIMVALFVMLGVMIFLLARSITNRVRQVAEAATAIADGRLEARVSVKGQDEVALLANSFNRMGDSLQHSHQRMRVLYKAIMELFACNDADAILRKAVELACTQCLGEAAWFLPESQGHEVAYADAAVFVGLHGWAWKNHRSVEVDAREATGIWRRVDGDRVFPFMMKNQGAPLGVLKVAYRTAPDEHMVSLLHSLISLVEMALVKQEQIRRGALVSTELGMAEAVQRNIMSENLRVSRSNRLAYHYQPASRFGGDWFYLIEDQERDQLYVVMGDVTGHGLAQGLVTTAVKGALDVVEHLLRSENFGKSHGPKEIVTLLETVVWRVAGPIELTMTCMAATVDFRKSEIRVCNAGHTFPILFRAGDEGNAASHLSKNQQPLLGPARNHHYEETTYPLVQGDMLVIYTDGLSEAKNLKSGIFGRFLFRGLKKAKGFESAQSLKDEILEMFRYYTQDSRVEDDVCFLVVQVNQEEQASERSA